MSKPEVGQWWFPDYVKPGGLAKHEAVYIVGQSTKGDTVYQSCPEGYFDADDFGVNDDQGGWHHEPRCDGWDWVVPADPTPPANQLDPDEWVVQDRVAPRKGIDEIRWSDWEEGRWLVAGVDRAKHKKHGYIMTDSDCVLSVRCRRRDLPPVEQPEQWPKYYRPSQECITADGKPVAFFKMRGVDDGETFHSDGTSFRWSEWVSGLAPVELTEAEAMALLKKPEPQPAKPNYGQWFRCKDDHTDYMQFQAMSGHDIPVPLVTDIHGYQHMMPSFFDEYEPCESPQPAKTRVRLWMRNEPKGRPSLFSCDEQPYPGTDKYKEIHHDEHGFYTL